jgi:magnesium transporter
MLVYKNNQPINQTTIDLDSDGNYFYLLNISEIELLAQLPEIKWMVSGEFKRADCASKYEYHDGYDMIYVKVPNELKDSESFRFLAAYITAAKVVCVYEEWSRQPFLVSVVQTNMDKGMPAKKVLLFLIDLMTRGDFDALGKIEDKIAEMEDTISASEITANLNDISALRRNIHPLKRFYEYLTETLDDLIENNSGFYLESDLKYAMRINGRVDRLFRTVINLRDYITQVREACQSQMDIGLNRIMKTFTVITAVFLPLTLLAGWYGMNLKMPEFEWEYGYLFVIGISLSIILLCFIFFKKKKWY